VRLLSLLVILVILVTGCAEVTPRSVIPETMAPGTWLVAGRKADFTQDQQQKLQRMYGSLNRVTERLRKVEPLINSIYLTFVISPNQTLTNGQDPKMIKNAYVYEDALFLMLGMFAQVKNEDELAAILAHEVAHIKMEHGQSMSMVGGGLSVLGMMGDMMLCAQTSVCGNLSQPLTGMLTATYSRSHEREADAVGFQILCKAGYRTSAVSELWVRVAIEQPRSGSIMDTHPTSEERSENMKALTCER
jgi:Zn-dependent protease with chaperone function